jgi:hypothetical protein
MLNVVGHHRQHRADEVKAKIPVVERGKCDPLLSADCRIWLNLRGGHGSL